MQYLNKPMVNIFIIASLVFTLLLALPASAQNLPVTWGAEQKFEKRIRISNLMAGKDNYFYVVKRNTSKKNQNTFIIEKYQSDNVIPVAASTFVLPDINSRQSNFEDIIVLENNIWLLVSQYINEQKHKLAYAMQIDNYTLQIVSNPIEIDRINIINPNRMPGFDFKTDKNAKHLLVYHHHLYEKYNNEKFSYKVYNAYMQLQWKKDIELPYRDKEFTVSDYKLDDALNVYMLSTFTPEKIKGQDTRNATTNRYVLLAYYPKENKIKEFEISLGDKWVSAVTFELAPNGDLAIGGFYSNTPQYSLAGTFYLRINQYNQQVVSKALKAFDTGFMRQFMPEKKIKKGKELSDFYFDHFIVREDGSALFIAEQYYMQIVYNYNDPFGYPYGYYTPGFYSPYYFGRTTYNYQYYYNDLIVVSVNAAGDIQWTKKIPKRQMSTNDGGYYLSYSLGVTKNNIYILFNDNRNNAKYYGNNYNEPQLMTRPNKSIATLIKIDNTGKTEWTALFNTKDNKLVLRPKMYFQADTNKLLIFCQKANNYKFGMLDLK
jgi:hypothetical protein